MEIRNLTYSLTVEDNSKPGVTKFGKNVKGAAARAADDVEALRTKMRRTTSTLTKDFQRIERTATPPLEKVRKSFERKRRTIERYKREMSGVPGEVERANRTLRNLDQQLERTERRIKGTTNSLRAMALAFQKVRSLAIVGTAAYGVARAGSASIGTAAGFEQQLSAVQAVTRISSKTSDIFNQLTDQARELGATTVFTARQAGEGMEYLARAGFDANQVLMAMPGTLALAAAGQLDLGRAADISSNVLTGFNLAAEDADRVADVLADSAASANTNVSQLGDAMKFVAPVSAGLGVSLEETTAAISALSDAGLQGEMAGTGLRRVLIGLADPSDDLQAKLNGISLESDGLVAVLDQLALSGLNVTEAIDEFEQRGGPAAAILVEFRKKVRGLSDQFVEANGAARDISTTMIDNLSGAAKQATSALSDLAIEMGEGGLLEGARNLVDSFTEAMRSDGALELARSLGGGLGSVLNGIADNWQLIGTLTQTATNFALIYGAMKFVQFLAGLKAIRAAWAGLAAATGVAQAAASAFALSAASVGVRTAGAATAAVSLSAATRGLTGGLVALRAAAIGFVTTPLGAALTIAAAAFGALQLRSAAAAAQLERDQEKMRGAFSELGLVEALNTENQGIARALEIRQGIVDEQGDAVASALEAEAGRVRRKLERLGLGAVIDDDAEQSREALDRRADIIAKAVRSTATELGVAQGEVKSAFEQFDLAAAIESQSSRAERAQEIYNGIVGKFIEEAKKDSEELIRLSESVLASARMIGPRGDMAALRSTQQYRQESDRVGIDAEEEARERAAIAAQFADGSQGYELALNTSKSLDEIRAIVAEAEDLKALFGDLQTALDQIDSQNARRALEEAQALARQQEQLAKLAGAREGEQAALEALRVSERAYEIELLVQQTLRANADITRDQAEEHARGLMSIREQNDALREQRKIEEGIQDLRDGVGRGEREIRRLWDALAVSKEEYLVLKETFRLQAQTPGLVEAEARALAERNVRLKEGLDTAEAIAAAYEDVPGATAGRRGRVELQRDAFGNLRERTREFGEQLKDVWADVFTSFVDEGIDAFDIISDHFRDRSRQNFRDLFDRLLDPNAPGINGPNPASGFDLRDLIFGRDTRGPIVGQDGTKVTGDPFATPNPRRPLSAQQIARGAAAGLNVYDGFQRGGTAGGLNAISQTAASSNEYAALAVIGGQIGTAIADAIDSNGANRTSAAFGQMFGAVGGFLAGIGSKSSSNGARVFLDGDGRVTDTFAKDEGRGEENLQRALQFAEGIRGTIEGFEDLLGGRAGSVAGGFQFDDRDGISFINRSSTNNQIENFGNDLGAALAYAVDMALEGFEGGDAALLAFAKAAVDAGRDIESAMEGLQAVSAALDLNQEPVSAYAQRLMDVNSAFDEADAAVAAIGGMSAIEAQVRAQSQPQRSPQDRDPFSGASFRFAGNEFEAAFDRAYDAQAFDRAAAELAAGGQSIQSAAGAVGQSSVALFDLAAERQEALQRVASDFDQQVRTDRLSIDSPLQAQAEALLTGQLERIRDASTLSEEVGGGAARMAEVLALNTAELTQFIEQAGTGPEAFLDLAGALSAVSAQAIEAGVDLDAVAESLDQARAGAVEAFNEAQETRLVQATNDVAYRYNEILKAQQDLVDQAKELGADVDLVQRANAAERQTFFDGLSDEEKIELGDALGLLEDNLGRTAYVLSSLNEAFSDQVVAADETAEEAQQLADQWRSIQDTLDQGIDQIRDRYRPGTLGEQSQELRSEFFAADARARDASLSIEERQAAAAEALRAGEGLLGVERQLGFNTTYFDTIFNEVTGRLDSLRGLAEIEGDSQQTRADSAQNTADALSGLYELMSQPSVEVPELINIQTQLAQANQYLSGQADSVLALLDEYIRNRQASDGLAAQAEQLIGALQGQITPDQLGVGSLSSGANDNGGANVVGLAGGNQAATVASSLTRLSALGQTQVGQSRTTNETAAQSLSVERDILEVLSAMRNQESQRQVEIIQSFANVAPQFQPGTSSAPVVIESDQASRQVVEAIQQMREQIANAVNESSASNAAANEDAIEELQDRVTQLERAVDESNAVLLRIEELLKDNAAATKVVSGGSRFL